MKWLMTLTVLGGLSCGPPYRAPCCIQAEIVRDRVYQGSMVNDAGVTTQVTVVVPTTGEASLTFVQGGKEIVERFTTTFVP
jgi:hypothetical protein